MTIDLSDANWFKSTRSGPAKDCVEVAWLAKGYVGVRDSKNPSAAALIFSRGEWEAFTTSVRNGGFDGA